MYTIESDLNATQDGCINHNIRLAYSVLKTRQQINNNNYIILHITLLLRHTRA